LESTPPHPHLGLCEHGKVRTVCPICRRALIDAQPIPRPPVSLVQVSRSAPRPRQPKEAVEARVSCAGCGARGTARSMVEDVDLRRFLCRTDAKTRSFAHVQYTTAGRALQASAPTSPHWADILRDSRATSIRAFTKAPTGQ
jgi:hypothetical protein